jgi:5'-deoxynucleotidase
MSNDNFFALISRMRYISRWGLMRNSLPENVQEHSHMVAVIAHALGVIRRDVYGVPCDPNQCAAVALYHDASEILTGDLPTPIKYHNAEIMDAYHQVEDLASQKLLSMLPVEMRGAYEPIITGEVEKELHPLVKAADKLSAPRRRPVWCWSSPVCRRWNTSWSTSSRPLKRIWTNWAQ